MKNETEIRRTDPISSDTERYRIRASFLLDMYTHHLERKKELKKQIAGLQYYSRDDIIYLLSGVKAVRYDSERVQSSNISNPCLKAVESVDEMMERMNSDIGREEREELQEVEQSIRMVEIAVSIMECLNPELAHAARQIYMEGKSRDAITDLSGSVYSRYREKRMEEYIIAEAAKTIRQEERFSGRR